MIVRRRPKGWRLFFVMQGSIVPKVAIPMIYVILISAIVSMWHARLSGHDLNLTPAPFTILGLALSVFLAFRNSVAYDRYWEGRKLWGELQICSRILARQVFNLTSIDAAADPLGKAMVYKTIAFCHALRHHLRDSSAAADLLPFLTGDELAKVTASTSPPSAIIQSLGHDLETCLSTGKVSPFLAASLDASLASLDRVLGGCERIKSTPIPFSYTLLLHRTACLYCFMLPFGLASTVGFATPIVAGLVSYAFFGLDALGDELEEPFGTASNDLPLTALCRGIEISLRERLGESDLPPTLLPVDFMLQ